MSGKTKTTANRQINIWLPNKEKEDMKIRLKNDGFSQKQFFASVIQAYIDRDDAFMEFIEKTRVELGICKSKKDLSNRKKSQTMLKNVDKELLINEDEIEDFFDIMEKEFPDL